MTTTVLTKRETQIVCLMKEGLSIREIADRLGIKKQTVKNQVHTIYIRAGLSRPGRQPDRYALYKKLPEVRRLRIPLEDK